MATLLIEHPITNLDTWLGAFNDFADARKNAGVQGQRVRQPIGDPCYIVVELDFDDPEARTRLQGVPRRRRVEIRGSVTGVRRCADSSRS